MTCARKLSIATLAWAVLSVLAPSSEATILDDFNSGELIADFLFDDASGTTIPLAANSVDPLATFDDDADSADVVTDGAGHLDASGKANTEFGSNYVDIPPIDYGRAIGLFEVQWAFDEAIYDEAQDEEFRLTMIQFDPRSTFVTGETFFTRTSATEVELIGNAVGTGAVDTAAATLGSSGSLLTLLDVNLDEDTLELWYSDDGGSSFTLLGGGELDPARGIESLRLVINEDFSNDRLLIERFALAHIVPEPASLTLIGLAALTLVACRRRAS